MNKAVRQRLSTKILHNGSCSLALSAGGARGAYQFGYVRTLIQSGLAFTSIAGSSIGALNGAIIAQGDMEKGRSLWMELTKAINLQVDYERMGKLALVLAADIGWFFLPVPNAKLYKAIKHASAVVKMGSPLGLIGWLKKYGLFKIEGLKSILEKHIDISSVIESRVPLYICVCGEPDLENPFGLPDWFRIQDLSEEDAWNAIWASMSVPFVFSPVAMNGHQFSDGGVGNWLPIEPLYQTGSRRIAAISTKANTIISPDKYEDAKIHVLGPKKPLGRFPIATFRFTEKAVSEWMEDGHVDAMLALDDGII